MAEFHGKNGREVLAEKPKKTRRGRPPGSYKLDMTPDQLKRVETLAGYGLNQKEAAAIIGITEPTLLKYREQFQEFNLAWQRGKEKAKAYVAGKLMQKIEECDLPAIKWYEQTRCGYSEKIKTENEHTHKVESLEDYLRRVKNVGSNDGENRRLTGSSAEETKAIQADSDRRGTTDSDIDMEILSDDQ